MNFEDLRAFVAVAENLSFTRGAAALGVAQPALSQRIKKFEASLGVTLFLRDNRSVSLSEYGMALLPRAQQLLGEARAIRRALSQMHSLESGELRVGASGTLAAFLLPELLARFRKQYPRITFQMVLLRSAPILELVARRELDVGLVRLPLPPSTAKVAHLFTEPLFVALPPTHRHAQSKSIRFSDLKDDPFIVPVREDEPFYGALLNWCAEDGFTPNMVSTGVEYTTAFRLVGMGLGVSVVSQLGTSMTVTPSPVFVKIDGPRTVSPVVIATAPNLPSLAAEAFANLALAEFKDWRGPKHQPNTR